MIFLDFLLRRSGASQRAFRLDNNLLSRYYAAQFRMHTVSLSCDLEREESSPATPAGLLFLLSGFFNRPCKRDPGAVSWITPFPRDVRRLRSRSNLRSANLSRFEELSLAVARYGLHPPFSLSR